MESNCNFPMTEVGKSYWAETGRYQRDYTTLYDNLVPSSGMAKTLFGEVVRAVSRLSYEYYNNGNCNACERTETEGEWIECSCCEGSGVCEDEDGEEYECPECGGEGGYQEEGEWETEINDFYGNLLSLVTEFFKSEMPGMVKVCNEIEDIILKGDDYTFSDEEQRPYVMMVDAVVYIIKSKAVTLQAAMQRSPEIPEWYKNAQN